MPTPPDDLNDITKKLHASGTKGPDDMDKKSLGKLEPTDPILDWVRGREDQLKAAQEQGQNLRTHGVTLDEKDLSREAKPDQGIDR